MSLAPHVLVGGSLDAAGQGVRVPVPEATVHHLRRVLRLGDGAVLSLTDGAGARADGTLDGDGAVLAGPVVRSAAPVPSLVLVQALPKGRRGEDAVRVACELGVDRIVPVVAARTQGRPDARAADALVTRWRAVAVAALEQSRGVRLAAVDTVAPSLAAVAPEPDEGRLRLVAVPGGPDLPDVLGAAPAAGAGRPAGAPTEVVIAIGPEGGWSAEEVAAVEQLGWSRVGLGPTVLRTEHAGPVALAVASALLGRWRGPGPDVADATGPVATFEG